MERNVNLDPAIKAWLENVVVPALVRQYRADVIALGDNEQDRFARLDSGTSTPEY